MKRSVKTLPAYISVLSLIVLSSCFSQKNIVRHNMTLTETHLKGIKADKVYKFYFNNGYDYKVYMNGVNDSKLYGTIISARYRTVTGDVFDEKEMKHEPFVYPYDELLENTDKVTVRKFNPYLTVIAAPFACVGGILIYFLISGESPLVVSLF